MRRKTIDSQRAQAMSLHKSKNVLIMGHYSSCIMYYVDYHQLPKALLDLENEHFGGFGPTAEIFKLSVIGKTGLEIT